jgi:hypothetical protein
VYARLSAKSISIPLHVSSRAFFAHEDHLGILDFDTAAVRWRLYLLGRQKVGAGGTAL